MGGGGKKEDLSDLVVKRLCAAGDDAGWFP